MVGAVDAGTDHIWRGDSQRNGKNRRPGHHQEVHRQPRSCQIAEGGSKTRHVRIRLVSAELSVKRWWADLKVGPYTFTVKVYPYRFNLKVDPTL